MFNTLLILSDFERHSKIKKVIDDSIRFYLGKIQKEIVKQTELEFFFSHKSGLNPKQSGQNLVKTVKFF